MAKPTPGLFAALVFTLCTPARGQQQHVGAPAQEKRDEILKSRSDAPRKEYTAGKEYNHLPVIKFHHGGAMDLCSVSVVGTTRGQPDPYQTEALWVEDQKGEVVYLQEDGVHGGFAVATHLKVPGTQLTPMSVDEDGIWVGETLSVPKSVPPPTKEEL